MGLVAYYSFQNKVVQVFSVLLVAGAGSLVQTGLVLLVLLMMTQMGLVGLVLLLVLVGLVDLVLLLVLVGLVHLLVLVGLVHLLVLLVLAVLEVLLVLVVLLRVGLEVALDHLQLLALVQLESALLDRKPWCKKD